MGDSLPGSLTSRIPLEVFNEILSYLPRNSLLLLRVLNHQLGTLATAHAFRHVHIGAREDKREHELVMRIAQSKHLRTLVREATCDTWVGPDFEYSANEHYRLPSRFLNALPYLRFFRNLSGLHIVFSRFCGHNTPDTYLNIEETTDFRYRVLDTIFQSVAGTWSAEQQKTLDWAMDLRGFEPVYDQTVQNVTSDEIAGRLPLRTLTVSNLADYDDERFTKSDVFKSVLESKDLVDLKLQITTQFDDAAPENEFYLGDKYDLFLSLPFTWLSPTVAGNLTTLSLYCREHWGWNPKMDFRAVRPGTGADAGFPNLKILALGKYVFSHEWQVDWIASLGRMNGSGGLEKLYLDNCPIMYHALHLKPLDESTTVVGKDTNGDDIVISNEGYHRRDLLGRRGPTQRGNARTHAKRSYPLRWHYILSRWDKSMTGLRVFKMGCGALTTSLAIDDYFPVSDADTERLGGSIHPKSFQYFDCLPPPPDGTPDKDIDRNRYTSGIGLSQRRNCILQYAFGGNDTVVVDRTRNQRLDPEKENTDVEDEQALKAFYDTVEARRMRA